MRLFPTLALLLLSAVASAHGGGGGHKTTELRLLMGEMYFQVDGQDKKEPLRLKAGERYELVFENVGNMKHEVLLGRDVVQRDGRPSDYREHLLASVEVDIEIETTVNGKARGIEIEATGIKELEFEPGTKATLAFELPADAKGRWELGCFIPGHYEAGMRLDVHVE
jgi:uncharacterized cupredoxin-like copper-binding protein